MAMTFLDPNTLFDVGFQFSFIATLGLMIYARPFADSTRKILARLFNSAQAHRVVSILNDALLVTLAAQVTTLPLMMAYFRHISTVALIVNPLVLPAQTGMMTLDARPRQAGRCVCLSRKTVRLAMSRRKLVSLLLTAVATALLIADCIATP